MSKSRKRKPLRDGGLEMINSFLMASIVGAMNVFVLMFFMLAFILVNGLTIYSFVNRHGAIEAMKKLLLFRDSV